MYAAWLVDETESSPWRKVLNVKFFKLHFKSFRTTLLSGFCNTKIPIHHSWLWVYSTNKSLPPQCSIKLSVLGALTSLLLVNGVPPVTPSSILLHYFIHDLELNSITLDLLWNWYLDLRKLWYSPSFSWLIEKKRKTYHGPNNATSIVWAICPSPLLAAL